MGLAQRNFLDLVETSRPHLEIAIVLDGTDSMAESLAGVKQAIGSMIDDLQLYKENNVAFQLVIFHDSGIGSDQEVIFPLDISNNAFTPDREIVRQAVLELEPSSGAPYFPELIDVGIHRALTELSWTDGDETTRWLLVFGDAPPYESGFREESTGATRRIATDLLVSVAKRKGHPRQLCALYQRLS